MFVLEPGPTTTLSPAHPQLVLVPPRGQNIRHTSRTPLSCLCARPLSLGAPCPLVVVVVGLFFDPVSSALLWISGLRTDLRSSEPIWVTQSDAIMSRLTLHIKALKYSCKHVTDSRNNPLEKPLTLSL